jgi:hypothetical protein
MRSTSLTLLLSLVVMTAACHTEKLTRRAPKLELTVYTTGQAYESFDDEARSIALGEVPVYATKWAIFQMSNPTQVPLKIDGVFAVEEVGLRWQEAHWLNLEDLDPSVRERPFNSPAAGKKFYDCNLDNALCELSLPECSGGQVPALVNGCETACIEPKSCLAEIPAFGVYLLGIAYMPLETGEHHVAVELHSNAANDATQTVAATARATFTGAPDIEVHYNSYDGPAAVDCTTTSCIIPEANGLNFGNIGLGAVGTAMLTIRNTAQCAAYIGIDACSLCGLTIDKDPSAYNLGIGFKPGANPDGMFAFGASTRVPFDILQRNMDCADAINPNRRAEGSVTLLVNFNAPMIEGEYRTSIIIESSDPDEPVVEVPIIAYARNAPIAIAKLREFDPLNPSAPYTDPTNIQPLRRVYFDGRKSYDPRDPANPALLTTWEWKVLEYPVGTDPGMFQPQGFTTSLANFWLPLAGHYVVGLTVGNDVGIMSGDTTDSRVEFDVIPGSRIHVQLTWDDGTNDQDLHLMKLPDATELCDTPWDCYFGNKEPVWFSTDPVATGANPRLDIDDTNGLGPENTNIDDPEPGTYRIAVHYWRGTAPTRNTVRVYLNGLQVAEYRRTLNEEDKWLIADIKWGESGTGVLTPYASDVTGQVGTVSTFPTSSCGGFGF